MFLTKSKSPLSCPNNGMWGRSISTIMKLPINQNWRDHSCCLSQQWLLYKGTNKVEFHFNYLQSIKLGPWLWLGWQNSRFPTQWTWVRIHKSEKLNQTFITVYAKVVIKWSACSPSTLMIRVQIPLKPTVFSVKMFEKNKNKQKICRGAPF